MTTKTTKTAALFCLLALPFSAAVITVPGRAQTKPAESFAPPQNPSPQEEAARKAVAKYNDIYAQFTKVDGAAFAVRVMYADDFVDVQSDGRETDKAALLKQIAEGENFQSEEQAKQRRKEEGMVITPLPKDKQTWRPDRYEVSRDRGGVTEVCVFTSPVQKMRQKLPFGKNGEPVDVDIKVLLTQKETYRQKVTGGRPYTFASGTMALQLRRREIVGMKTYLNGKLQSADFNTGDAPPKL